MPGKLEDENAGGQQRPRRASSSTYAPLHCAWQLADRHATFPSREGGVRVID